MNSPNLRFPDNYDNYLIAKIQDFSQYQFNIEPVGEVGKFATQCPQMCPSILSLFFPETVRADLFLGFLVHIVRRDRDEIIAKEIIN